MLSSGMSMADLNYLGDWRPKSHLKTFGAKMYTQDGSMGLVYLATWMVVFDGEIWYINVGTHLKFNTAPQKLPSQKENSLPTIHFQGLC